MPPVGARRRDWLTEALGAFELELTVDALTQIKHAVAAGERYATPMMAELNSERGRASEAV